MQAIINGDVSVGLRSQAILNNGKDASQFIEDLINYCQNILLYKQDSEMVEASELGLLVMISKKLLRRSNLLRFIIM